MVAESLIFPPGYGDFAMQSSDSVVFHFPRAILAHVSPLFRDMFSVSTHAANTDAVNTEEPLFMEEKAETISLMLQHIDPATETPSFDFDTIADLAKAAHKYQIDIIIQRFQVQSFNIPRNLSERSATPSRKSLISDRPLLALYVADFINSEQVAKYAINNLITASSSDLEEDIPIRPDLMLYIMKLRQERTKWLLDRISVCRKKFKDDKRSKCWECCSIFYRWVAESMASLYESPGNASIRKLNYYRCNICCNFGKNGYRTGWWVQETVGIKALLREVQKLESTLPEILK